MPLQFTRRQYQTLLRRMGVKEPGVAYQENPVLVALLDDLRCLLPEQTRPHAYVFQNSAAVAGQYSVLELSAPQGGMWIEQFGQVGCAARWGWFRSIATLISTGQAEATRVDIQEAASQATFEVGTAAVYVGNISGQDYATGVETVELTRPLYIPPARKFCLQNGTANDACSFMIRWREPGV